MQFLYIYLFEHVVVETSMVYLASDGKLVLFFRLKYKEIKNIFVYAVFYS